MTRLKTPNRFGQVEIGPAKGKTTFTQKDGEYLLRVMDNMVPASSASTGLPGQFASDNTNLYRCDSDGSWRQLSTLSSTTVATWSLTW